MILFLTSSPCDDNVPEGVDLPCIFFKRNGFVANLREAVAPGSRCVIIASWPEGHAHNDEMARTFAGCFAYDGMEFSDMTVIDSRTADRAAELIFAADVVILAGGHVPTQNAFFASIGLREIMHQYEGVVMGISAGSMNAADVVYAQPEEPGEAIDPDYQRFIPGLGLTNINVLPHYQMVKDNILDGQRLYEDITFADSADNLFFVLVDGSYIVQQEEGAELFGEAYVIQDGVMGQICEDGESISL